MIQRKQTLFLLALFFATLTLAMIPCNFIHLNSSTLSASVLIIPGADLHATTWHYLGSGLLFVILLLSLVTIFIYKNRNMQVRFCYILMLLQLALTAIVSFCPVVDLPEGAAMENSGLAAIIGIIGMMGAYLAARFIKKDIELLKSADRIR